MKELIKHVKHLKKPLVLLGKVLFSRADPIKLRLFIYLFIFLQQVISPRRNRIISCFKRKH